MRCHAHVVENVGQLTRVDAAIVGDVFLTSLVHVEVTGCKEKTKLLFFKGWWQKINFIIYRQFSFGSRDNLSLVIPNNKTIEH